MGTERMSASKRVGDAASAAKRPPRAGNVERLQAQLVVAAFARLRPGALGLSVGVVSGAALLIATAVLLLSPAGRDGASHVGTHLRLLKHFYPGYEITWLGAVIGGAYAFVSGFLFGVVLAWLLNISHRVYVRAIQRGLRRGVMHDAL